MRSTVSFLVIVALSCFSNSYKFKQSLFRAPARKTIQYMRSTANIPNEYSITVNVPKEVFDIYSSVSDGKIIPPSIGNPADVLSSFANQESLQSLKNAIPTNILDNFASSIVKFGVTSPTELFGLNSFLMAAGLGVAALLMSSMGSSFFRKSGPFDDGAPVYDIDKMENFYRSRPWLIANRLIRILLLASGFNTNLLLDWRFGNLEKNQKDRAKEALGVLSQLGPTFVKLGQALSIRTDLIPDAYAFELRKLQDAVPPFDNDNAKAIICRELGIKDLSERFKVFSKEPIAAASIGQVYKAVLLNGEEVAVKVQRPDILGEIALDLYLLRLVAPLQVKLSNLVSGSPTEQADLNLAYSLVDEWGRGLVAEVDYLQEAKNTKQFVEAMKKRGLNAVTSPQVKENVSTSKVLVTEWISGTRLDRDSSADVPRYRLMN